MTFTRELMSSSAKSLDMDSTESAEEKGCRRWAALAAAMPVAATVSSR